MAIYLKGRDLVRLCSSFIGGTDVDTATSDSAIQKHVVEVVVFN